MMDTDVDMELLISLVENRPVLWDKTLETYKNKRLNFIAWNEICRALNENFDSMSELEKSEYGKLVSKKWTNARDNFTKYVKKLKEFGSGSGSEEKPIKRYRFYNQMKFLLHFVRHRNSNLPTDERLSLSEEDVEDDEPLSKRIKTENDHDLRFDDARIINYVESVDSGVNKDNSRVMSFFKSIAPTVEKFNDNDFVEFQYEVMKVVRVISKKDRASHSAAKRSESDGS